MRADTKRLRSNRKAYWSPETIPGERKYQFTRFNWVVHSKKLEGYLYSVYLYNQVSKVRHKLQGEFLEALLKEAEKFCNEHTETRKRLRSNTRGVNTYFSEMELKMMLKVFPDHGNYAITRRKILRLLEKLGENEPHGHSKDKPVAGLKNHPLDPQGVLREDL